MARAANLHVEASVDARAFVASVGRFTPALVRAIQLKLARVTGPRLAKAVRRLTARRTGRLRRSVYHEVSGRSPIVLRIGYDEVELIRLQVGKVRRPRPYAQWVEKGTENRAGKLVLPRVMKRQRRKIARDVQEAVAEAGRRVIG